MDTASFPDATRLSMADNPHRFEVDLDRGIRDRLVERLEASPRLPLQRGGLPAESGVYALCFRGRLVYVGKASSGTTKSRRTLRARLNEHIGKIEKRQNITLADMTCRYLIFESEWWVFAAEFALMDHYRPEWNGTGFGSKAPGAGRPGIEAGDRNMLFPRRNSAGYRSQLLPFRQTIRSSAASARAAPSSTSWRPSGLCAPSR